jgi:hypothetical protein
MRKKRKASLAAKMRMTMMKWRFLPRQPRSLLLQPKAKANHPPPPFRRRLPRRLPVMLAKERSGVVVRLALRIKSLRRKRQRQEKQMPQHQHHPLVRLALIRRRIPISQRLLQAQLKILFTALIRKAMTSG